MTGSASARSDEPPPEYRSRRGAYRWYRYVRLTASWVAWNPSGTSAAAQTRIDPGSRPLNARGVSQSGASNATVWAAAETPASVRPAAA